MINTGRRYIFIRYYLLGNGGFSYGGGSHEEDNVGFNGSSYLGVYIINSLTSVNGFNFSEFFVIFSYLHSFFFVYSNSVLNSFFVIIFSSTS